MNLLKKSGLAAVMGLIAFSVFASNVAKAESNPFAAQNIVTVVSEDAGENKCGEGKKGKCGKAKGKCGEGKKGKCGKAEGKCGEGKKGKCGKAEGKCGESKKGKCGKAKGKCGESKK